MEFIVDMLAFNSPKAKFIVKELTIVNVQTGAVSWFLFKPPCAAKDTVAATLKENIWLTNNFHGISWEEGDVPYAQLRSILTEQIDPGSRVYVKGEEKANFIQKLTSANVVDLQTLGCPSLRRPNFWLLTPQYTCPRHNGTNFVCARDQALKLFSWYISNKLLH